MSWQPSISNEITRLALERASNRSQLRSTPGSSVVQQAVFNRQLKGANDKPAAPKPVSDGTRSSLLEGAIQISEQQKAAKGAEIARGAIGVSVPSVPAMTDYERSIVNSISGLREPSPLDTSGLTTVFDEDDFKNQIIQRSIFDNRKTGGRHPKAGKSKETKLDGSAPAPKPTLDRGDELSREIDQSALNDMATRLAGEGIQFRHGFNSNDLPGSDGTYSHGDFPIMGGVSFAENSTVMSPEALKVLFNSNDVSSPQSGVSPIADEADSARAVPVPGSQKLGGLSARSRAFLDYEGGSLGALRAAEASQDYMRQGGRNYAITGKDAEGNYTYEEFDDAGRKALVKDGNSTINHEFMDTYQMGDRPTPDQAQSPEIGFTTKMDLETMSPQRETPENFGVGDGSFEQLADFPGNAEKITLNPVDWMSMYRGGR
tara:strand:+ start:190 stop:1482 length:1293 start_codon:yes stop_codon:yes gene_type:complete